MFNKNKLKTYGAEKTILFIDDEEINKIVFVEDFKNYFKEIVVTSSEEEALRIFMKKTLIL